MLKDFYRAAFLLLAAGIGAGIGTAEPSRAAVDPIPGSASTTDTTAIAAESNFSEPETGAVSGDAYRNRYFDLALKLPSGWKEGLQGPPPSQGGYYVLGALEEADPGRSSLLLGAQDLFFGVKSFTDAADMAKDFKTGLSAIPATAVESGPRIVKLGGHDFQRIDYNSGGLARTWLATDLRCHIVILSYTGPDRAPIDRAVQALDSLSIGNRTDPVCVKDYVTQETTVRTVDLPSIEPRGLTIPVRLTVGKDGHVLHVHAIIGEAEIRRRIAEAVMQWELKPYLVDGKPVEFETGIIVGRSKRNAAVP